MKYYFYIDESWDHSLQNINEDFPYFLLCGVLISEAENNKLLSQVRQLKHDFFGTDQVILHSKDIRRHEGYFKILFDLSIKQKFYQNIEWIMTWIDFTIIANAVKKIDYIKQYGKSAINPYNISLSYLMERMVFCMDDMKWTQVEILVEKRGKKEDTQLLQHYNQIIDQWTYYVKPKRFQWYIHDFSFRDKRQNDAWIQLADLCAYPLISYVRDRDSNHPSYQIVSQKLYTNPKTKKVCWLKIIP